MTNFLKLLLSLTLIIGIASCGELQARGYRGDYGPGPVGYGPGVGGPVGYPVAPGPMMMDPYYNYMGFIETIIPDAEGFRHDLSMYDLDGHKIPEVIPSDLDPAGRGVAAYDQPAPYGVGYGDLAFISPVWGWGVPNPGMEWGWGYGQYGNGNGNYNYGRSPFPFSRRDFTRPGDLDSLHRDLTPGPNPANAGRRVGNQNQYQNKYPTQYANKRNNNRMNGNNYQYNQMHNNGDFFHDHRGFYDELGHYRHSYWGSRFTIDQNGYCFDLKLRKNTYYCPHNPIIMDENGYQASNAIFRIQYALTQSICNYYHGAVDGVLNPELVRAVTKFQKQNMSSPDLVTGVVDEETMRKLEDVCVYKDIVR